ncbi:MAG: Protein-disulfide isomerase [Parcubacteria group bacterium GW2011_GWF2_44_8]|nr:MAG: Protein-disulfide isomerase [Parcubacteria group bacterium GW2011_GWF2_44_8]
MKNPWVIIGIIVVILFGGSFWYAGSTAENNNEGITFEPHVKGNPDASVVLVEYSDFQCPACATFQPVLADVLDQFGDSIRFEYKHFPLPIHPLAEPAARAAEAAGQQGKFFEFHDVLFANQLSWSNSVNPAIPFVQYADELGLDVDTFKRHYNASLIRDRVREDLAEARQLELTGTPTFFLNGEKMVISTYEDFVNQIASAINPEAAAEASSTPAVEFGI